MRLTWANHTLDRVHVRPDGPTKPEDVRLLSRTETAIFNALLNSFAELTAAPPVDGDALWSELRQRVLAAFHGVPAERDPAVGDLASVLRTVISRLDAFCGDHHICQPRDGCIELVALAENALVRVGA